MYFVIGEPWGYTDWYETQPGGDPGVGVQYYYLAETNIVYEWFVGNALQGAYFICEK